MKPTRQQAALLRLLGEKGHYELDVGDGGRVDKVKRTQILNLIDLLLEEPMT